MGLDDAIKRIYRELGRHLPSVTVPPTRTKRSSSHWRNLLGRSGNSPRSARSSRQSPSPPALPDPILALDRRLGVESDPRIAFIDALFSSPHGRLAEFGRIHARVLESDPDFYGHIGAWYQRHGVIEDQRQLFCAHLAASSEDAHREASFVMLQRLRAYQVAMVVRYMKEILGTLPRRTKASVQWWLRRRECDSAWFDEVALRDRRSLKYLYATLRIAPSMRAAQILFADMPPPDSRLAAVKRLAKERDPLAVAKGIVENRIFASTAVGLIKQMDAPTLAALIDVMSPQQVINSLRSLERRGALRHPDLKGLIDEKLAHARTEARVQSARTLAAAAAIDDEGTRQQLGDLASERLRAIGRISRPTAIFVDKSGSMQIALEVGANVAALACTIADEAPLVYAFDVIARAIHPTGKDLGLAEWSAAFSRIKADGGTAIGSPFACLLREGKRIEQVVVITDGGENEAPYFSAALQQYEQAIGASVAIVVLLVNSRRGQSALERNLAAAGIDATTWLFEGDLYSLPNVVPFLVTPRRADLCAEILETRLPVRADLRELPPGFNPVTYELL
jgi:hypothetical protein